MFANTLAFNPSPIGLSSRASTPQVENLEFASAHDIPRSETLFHPFLPSASECCSNRLREFSCLIIYNISQSRCGEKSLHMSFVRNPVVKWLLDRSYGQGGTVAVPLAQGNQLQLIP